jgi:hypothetical protein
MSQSPFVTIQIQEKPNKNGVPVYDEVYKFSGKNAAEDAIIMLRMKYGIPVKGERK